MRLVLHIGAPKTGTTHLQTSLKRARKALRSQGILYPVTGTRFAARTTSRQVGLRFAYAPDDVDMSWMMVSCGMEEARARHAYAPVFRADLTAELAAARDVHTVIISDEALFSFSDARMITPMLQTLRTLFSEILVVALIRQPSDVIQGIYSQRVKKGSTLTWPEFMAERLEEPLYLEQLMLWQDQLAPHELAVRPARGDSITRFLEIAGITEEVPPAPKGANKSLSPVGIQVLRRINEKAAEANRKRPAAIRDAFEKTATGNKWVPDAADCLSIDTGYRAEIDGILDTFALGDADRNIIRNWYVAPDYATSAHTTQPLPASALEEMADAILELADPSD